MPPGIGYSFAPGGEDIDLQNGQRKGTGISPQQAVQIRSLRVPERLPTNAPVNRTLLTSPGGMAAGAQGLDSMVAALMQAFRPQASVAGPAPMPASAPSGGGSPEPLPSRNIPMPPSQAPTLGPVFEGYVDPPPQAPVPGLFEDVIDPQYWMTNAYWDPNANFDPWMMQAAQSGFLSHMPLRDVPLERPQQTAPKFIVENPTPKGSNA